jgi:integrase/recombinase XerD
MRGDTPGSADIGERGAVDEYIHSYYADVEAVYRERMVSLVV